MEQKGSSSSFMASPMVLHEGSESMVQPRMTCRPITFLAFSKKVFLFLLLIFHSLCFLFGDLSRQVVFGYILLSAPHAGLWVITTLSRSFNKTDNDQLDPQKVCFKVKKMMLIYLMIYHPALSAILIFGLSLNISLYEITNYWDAISSLKTRSFLISDNISGFQVSCSLK